MQCPQCKGKTLRVYGTFGGYEVLKFVDEEGNFRVIESEPAGEMTWEDHDSVDCMGCGHSGSVLDFQTEEN